MIVILRIMGRVIEMGIRVAIGMVKLDGNRDLEENWDVDGHCNLE